MPFSRPIRTEWCADGRRMLILEQTTYTDPAGKSWTVPVGFYTDGASIPDELWSIVGSPFTGRYRDAAVYHDAAYRTLGVTKDDADTMFLAAMLESGCEPSLAEMIHRAVALFGFDAYAAAQRRAAT